jgi:hypothetical protein
MLRVMSRAAELRVRMPAVPLLLVRVRVSRRPLHACCCLPVLEHRGITAEDLEPRQCVRETRPVRKAARELVAAAPGLVKQPRHRLQHLSHPVQILSAPPAAAPKLTALGVFLVPTCAPVVRRSVD